MYSNACSGVFLVPFVVDRNRNSPCFQRTHWKIGKDNTGLITLNTDSDLSTFSGIVQEDSL